MIKYTITKKDKHHPHDDVLIAKNLDKIESDIINAKSQKEKISIIEKLRSKAKKTGMQVHIPASIMNVKELSRNIGPICPYCNTPSQFVFGGSVHPNVRESAHKQFYECKPCDAHVGCFAGTTKPLGALIKVNAI